MGQWLWYGSILATDVLLAILLTSGDGLWSAIQSVETRFSLECLKMVPKFIYRWAKSCDYVELGVVMYDAVRHGSSCYSEQQRRAWMPQPKSDDQWIERLAKQRIEVAESDGCLLGFIGVLPDGYIDFAYVRSDYQQQGIFVCLYENIEGYARDQGLSQLTTDASLMAQPAFSKVGFTVLAKETVELRGEKFERFKMTKIL